MKRAGDAWGRIATLSSLADRIDPDDLFKQLESIDSLAAWEGATQVFASNLNHYVADGRCIRGLIRILENKNLIRGVIRRIETAFNPQKHGRTLDRDFAILFIEAIEFGGLKNDLINFLEWISDLAGREPLAALEVCESLVPRLNNLESPYRLWHTEPLIAALSSILREADESDDEELIRRAIRLQDQFLRMDIRGMDDFFFQSGYP